jgi:hypothetical protein
VKLEDSHPGGYYANGDTVITNGWAHLVAVYKQGQYVEYWVNGSLARSNTVPDYALYTDPNFPLNSSIGNYDYAPAPYNGFTGAIDDIRIYNRALSDSEVQQLYGIESTAVVQPRTATATFLTDTFDPLTIFYIFQQLLSELPSIIVCIGSILVALLLWRQAPLSSLYIVLALAPTLVLLIGYPVAWQTVHHLLHSDTAILRKVNIAFAAFWSIVRAISTILLVLAVYTGRRRGLVSSTSKTQP